MGKFNPVNVLLLGSGGRRYAIELHHVRGQIRTPMIAVLPSAPSFLRGCTQLQGHTTPVVDLNVLSGDYQARPKHFFALSAWPQNFVIAVADVFGVGSFDATSFATASSIIRPEILAAADHNPWRALKSSIESLRFANVKELESLLAPPRQSEPCPDFYRCAGV